MLVFGFWVLIFDFWFLVFGFGFLVLGFWFLVFFDFWFLVSGFRFLVLHSARALFCIFGVGFLVEKIQRIFGLCGLNFRVLDHASNSRASVQ